MLRQFALPVIPALCVTLAADHAAAQNVPEAPDRPSILPGGQPRPVETPDVRMPSGDDARGIPMPTGELGPEVYRERRRRLMEEMGGGVAVIFSADHVGPDDRQDLNFYYLTGLAHEAGAALLLAPEDPVSPETLFLAALDVEDNRWHGERAMLGRKIELGTGIARVRRIGRLPGSLASAVTKSADREMVSLGPIVGYTSPVPKELDVLRKASSRIPGSRIRLAHELLPAMRQAKSADEIAIMQRAVDITGDGHVAAMRAVRPGMTEFELQRAFERAFRDNGSRFNAYNPIVASGPNSCVLHYQRNDREMKAGDLVLCDVGCEYDMYAADITRTFPVSGRFTERQKEVYEVVLEAQRAAIEAVKPGVTVWEVHQAARSVIERAGFTDAYFHGTSHFIGLHVHDSGLYDEPLTPGSVITIEPGVYLADEEIGIRIEDEVLVTEGGAQVLSASIPKSIAEIESLMRAGRGRR